LHDVEYSGESTESKLVRVATTVKDCNFMIVQNLDEIAWLLNMRGNDIDYNPLFYSFVILTFKDSKYSHGRLYIKKEKLSKEVSEYLTALKFDFADYDAFYTDLGTIDGKVSVDLSSANSRIHRELTLNEKAEIENVKSVVKKFKGVKNDREVRGFKECHVRDGAALCQYFGWL